MGTWHGPDLDGPLMDALLQFDPAGFVAPAEFINAMRQSGLLVRRAYYVPDADELLGLMKTIQYHLSKGMAGCRWVMCRETVDALAKKWDRHRTPAPMVFNSAFWANYGADLPTAALEMEVLTVIESRRYWDDKDTLFGVPIRIDPAARSPMFEIDTPATAYEVTP